jgi:hypothetical protein
VSRSSEGAPNYRLRQPGVDEAEGAEKHGGALVKPHGPPSGLFVKFGETHDEPLLGTPTVGVLYREACSEHGLICH